MRHLFLLLVLPSALACGPRSGVGAPDGGGAGDAGQLDREDCRDAIDNDGDGHTDCTDTDCVAASVCRGDAGPPPSRCRVGDQMDAIGVCEERSPPASFEPSVQWTWTGSGADVFSIVSPLVGNLTDDDGNGEIDLCDVPDVLVVAGPSQGSPQVAGHIYVLDGASGAVHFMIAEDVDHTITPAIGDIDGDGLMEIVTADTLGFLLAFEHDGTFKWRGATQWSTVDVYGTTGAYSGAVALADLEGDGDVEIIAGHMVADHLGVTLWTAPTLSGSWSATTAADLDGDGDLEVVLGNAAYRYDGTALWTTSLGAGYPQIADLDMDGRPEVLLTNTNGVSLIEHDGTVRYQDLRPTGAPAGGTTWLRPATIHDFDGDGAPEYAVSSASFYTVYEADGSIVWSATVSDSSGIAAGTAFDFLGDGIAEAMYADEHDLFVFDGEGRPLLSMPRTSGTLTEYPVVADIDNDGSAEIVVVSNGIFDRPTPSPTVQVIRDREDRWIQARRIWNQHTYHVTNVREDGTIPAHEPPSWGELNTFRTNAQIEDGALCEPDLI